MRTPSQTIIAALLLLVGGALSAFAATDSLHASGASASAAVQDDAKDAQEDKDAAKEEWQGEPYTLETCALSGNPLDMKGTPTTATIEGRELKFCCKGCAAAVEKDPSRVRKEVDEQLTAQQAPLYPTEECIVSGESMMKDGEFTGEEFVVKNRLFRTCCGMCAKKVKADPGKYAAELDAMVLEAFAKEGAYPLETCVVVEKKQLTDSANAFVIAGRPVKTCCGGCERKVRAEPMKYLPKVDEALAEARGDDKKKDAPKKEGDKTDADKKGDGKGV